MPKKDVLLINIPLTEVRRPPAAVYHLKGQLEAGGTVTCKAVDACVILYNQMKDKWSDVMYNLDFGNMDPDPILFKEISEKLNVIVDREIQETDPTWIGVSIFSINSTRIGEATLRFIKSKYPNKKVLIGGTGLGDALGDTKFEYANAMLDRGYCDYFITGEAEVAIVELICKNNPNAVGINRPPKQIQNLEGLAFANYEDCNHDLYPWREQDHGETIHYTITGSRGCVRRCDFCDIYRLWPKFKTRGGEHIAKEMIHHYENSGVTAFYMSDSLVNGSMKAFRELYTTLLEYKQNYEVNFNWGGQFIARTESQMGIEDYKLARESGFTNSGWGLEHASERIRKLMRKGFNDDAVEDTLRNHSKAGISTMINFLFGHPLETEEDFLENVKFLYKYQKYNLDGTIASLNLQKYLMFLPGTDFFDAKYDMVEDINKQFWKTKPHLNTLTFREVYYRRKKISEISKELGYKTQSEDVFMSTMERDFARWKYNEEFNCLNEVNDNFDKEDDTVHNFIKQLEVTI
tara:strand:- start:2166 stop:3722 length:1557 start_codon:yes stop_codon:yes gene_type:complete